MESTSTPYGVCCYAGSLGLQREHAYIARVLSVVPISGNQPYPPRNIRQVGENLPSFHPFSCPYPNYIDLGRK